MTDYRYPNERLILAITLFLVLAVIAVTATATLCGSVLFVALMLFVSYALNRVHHEELIRKAQAVTPQTAPELAALTQMCASRLQVDGFATYVAPAAVLNAYTFGLVDPKVVVVYSGMLRVMDADELRFIIGHELGHIRLGHTWLNSLVGGMAGIPSPYMAAVILHFAFRWWNRACEYSADRAGLLACGKPEKAISALIKLTGGGARSAAGMQAALQRIEAEDDDLGNVLGEALSTHPLMVRRIEALRRFVSSGEYRRCLGQIEARAT